MLDISELSRRTGFAASKLRYYEEVGLIRSIGRKGLKRLFEEEVVTRLALISLGQTAGLSLTEIRELIGTEGRPALDRTALKRKADLLDSQISELTDLRNGIRHIINCRADNHLDCARFRRIMRAAMSRKSRG